MKSKERRLLYTKRKFLFLIIVANLFVVFFCNFYVEMRKKILIPPFKEKKEKENLKKKKI